jgi:predicted sulfurtransferase
MTGGSRCNDGSGWLEQRGRGDVGSIEDGVGRGEGGCEVNTMMSLHYRGVLTRGGGGYGVK